MSRLWRYLSEAEQAEIEEEAERLYGKEADAHEQWEYEQEYTAEQAFDGFFENSLNYFEKL